MLLRYTTTREWKTLYYHPRGIFRMCILGYGTGSSEWRPNNIVDFRMCVPIRIGYFLILRSQSYNDITERGILHIDGGIYIDGSVSLPPAVTISDIILWNVHWQLLPVRYL